MKRRQLATNPTTVWLYKIGIAYVLFCISITASATPSIDINNYWECRAYDSTDKEWVAQGTYDRVAINEAFSACKKQSSSPGTCQAPKEKCEVFINGRTTRPMWRCTSLDQLSKAWRSGIYSQRNDAALAAKAYCHQHSAMPDTCYINLLMCKNLNELNG